MTAGPPPFARSGSDEARAYWESQPFASALGIRVEALEPGVATLLLERSGVSVSGIRDSLNGGVVAACAELAGRLALYTELGDGESLGGTVDLSVSFISAARGDPTRVVGRLLRKGGRLCVSDVEVRDGQSGALNAKARVTTAIARPPR